MSIFHIFRNKRLDEFLGATVDAAALTIQKESPDYILNVNEAEYVEHLNERFSIDQLQIEFEHIQVSAEERMVEAQDFFFGDSGKKYRKQVVIYHLPFSGDPNLFQCQPNPGMILDIRVHLDAGCVCFEIVDYTNSAEEIKAKADDIISNIRKQHEFVVKQVEGFCKKRLAAIKQAFDERKRGLLEKRAVLTSLGVPIRKAKDVPATFSVPAIRKKILAKPTTLPIAGAPTPTLDPTVYQDILRTIFDMGKVFERLPNTYSGKDEPTLRDHLILQLEPRFEGSTTGETFNKAGKTDILIRHEKNNIFVAECKFWDGKAAHLRTIDQLLSYLSWRDSKTAIVYFVNRKEIVPILKEISTTTPQHPCYVKSRETLENGSWQLFDFRLPTDKDCKLQITILAFHIPSTV